MRAANVARYQRERAADECCPDCRGGLLCAAPWEAWLSRRDDAEASWLAERASLTGFDASPELAELLDQRPDCEEETPCPACGGTGVAVRRRARRAA